MCVTVQTATNDWIYSLLNKNDSLALHLFEYASDYHGMGNNPLPPIIDSEVDNATDANVCETPSSRQG